MSMKSIDSALRSLMSDECCADAIDGDVECVGNDFADADIDRLRSHDSRQISQMEIIRRFRGLRRFRIIKIGWRHDVERERDGFARTADGAGQNAAPAGEGRDDSRDVEWSGSRERMTEPRVERERTWTLAEH